jgi:hypothetical protein
VARGYGRQIERLLRDAGCNFVGTARATTKSGSARSATATSFSIAAYTANGILQDAGLPKAF